MARAESERRLDLLQRRLLHLRSLRGGSPRGAPEEPSALCRARRVGRLGQRRRDPPPYRRDGRPRLPGDPPVAAPTDEDVLIPISGGSGGTSRRWTGHRLRPIVVRPGPGRAGRRLRQADQWQRAYNEIVEFERPLVLEQTVIVKFWLHISDAEQLRRFRIASERSRSSLEADRGRLAEPGAAPGVCRGRRGDGRQDRSPTRLWELVPAESKHFAGWRSRAGDRSLRGGHACGGYRAATFDRRELRPVDLTPVSARIGAVRPADRVELAQRGRGALRAFLEQPSRPPHRGPCHGACTRMRPRGACR